MQQNFGTPDGEDDLFMTSVTIRTDAATVWRALTNPAVMKQWLGDPEMGIEIVTDWTVGEPIVIRGNHNGPFENRGVVLVCDYLNALSYTHLSSVSHLPDLPRNYAAFSFSLSEQNFETVLKLEVKNFATESIRKHLIFYWRTTLVLIKNLLEQSGG